jgi:hypothetical protein
MPLEDGDVTPAQERRLVQSEREVEERSLLGQYSAVCVEPSCPGVGEPLTFCLNPDHWTVGHRDPYFHRQRAGHGAKRRGRPAQYCSPECSRWVDDHYGMPAEGQPVRKVRVWTVPSMLRTNSDVVLRSHDAQVRSGGLDYTATDRQAVTFGDYRRAESIVRQALTNGFFDCDPGCGLPGHVHRPYKEGDTVFNATFAPAADGNGSFAESIGSLYLTPDILTGELSLQRPRALTNEDGDDTGDWGDVHDPSATADDAPNGIARRVMALLPRPLRTYLLSRAPSALPAKAVAMLARYAVMEQDAEVSDLYLDIVSQWPEYAAARATAAEVRALINDLTE